jgi:hypothetical protein
MISKPKTKTFDECLDEAFTNIIRGKLEDVRRALDKFTEKVRAGQIKPQ